MKTRPILMNAEMVRATLEGRKTQTRRIIKGPEWFEGHSIGYKVYRDWEKDKGADGSYSRCICARDGGEQRRCPYGEPYDQLWVRETWGLVRSEDKNLKVRYAADGKLGPVVYGKKVPPNLFKNWTERNSPSIHMPRWASRLTLEITEVSVERLQDITNQDAKAEGAPVTGYDDDTVLNHFHDLWESIHGSGSWDQNPWIWVIGFKPLVTDH
jgi:hypothetical protein